jgi:hypothetical protein
VSKQRPIDPEQRAALEAEGFRLFSFVGPLAPGDKQHDYHFRRAIGPTADIGGRRR